MQQADLAREILMLADRDLLAVRVLAARPEVAAEAVGLYAQQAVEKYVKTVLAFRGIAFGRMHDFLELIG